MVAQPNTNIPLSAMLADTNGAIQTAKSNQLSNEQATENLLKSHYETMDAREKSRLSSVVVGATQLKSYLESGDMEGAKRFLQQRRNELGQRMAAGEPIDTEDTDYAIQALESGNVEQLMNDVNGVIAAGRVYGIGSSSEMPSNVREWQYFNSLSPEDQKRYVIMKRANPSVDLGNEVVFPNPVNPAAAPQATLPKGLAPADQPANAGAKAEAVAAGTATGEQQGANAKKEYDAKANRNYIQKAITLLPKATSGAVETGVKTGAQAFGVSTESSRADRQLKILSAKLVGTVPRFEGPQGVLDVQLYQEAAGDLANTQLPVEDRMAAAELMLDLLDDYGATGTGGGNTQPPATNSGAGGGGGFIRVTNGKETLEIPEADLPNAQRDGFQIQQ